MAKVITFGEIMLRLATPGYLRFNQAKQFEATFGGGEANVAVSLANYGHDAEFVTKVPENPIGECAVAALRKHNVCTKNIARGGERLGIYFLETGASMRASNVVYDRAHSSIATATADDFDFDAIFADADWFHFTGITPAIGGDLVNICLDACKAAKAKGVKISCDLNYRGKLWTREEARKAMTELCKYIGAFYILLIDCIIIRFIYNNISHPIFTSDALVSINLNNWDTRKDNVAYLIRIF